MKIIKRILIILASLLALILIVALFVKKEYAVERSISVNKPKQDVFNYIKFLKNQNYYSKWNSMDPEMTQEYKGTDGTVGFISAWDSKKDDVGKGEQEIIKITEGERLDMELRFIQPFEATDYAYMTTESESETSTKVKWGFNGKMKYPMNLFLLVMDMDAMLGKDLDVGLTNLKSILEKQQ
jgi:hypothetical protein